MADMTEAQRLAAALDALLGYRGINADVGKAAAELRRLEHNTTILMNALMKACGDDEEMVKEIIESQGELK
jgi:hypothetical protein